MVNCFLCFGEGRKNRFVDFNASLGDGQSIGDAVRIYFPFIPVRFLIFCILKFFFFNGLEF